MAKNSNKNKGGRPRAWTSPSRLQKLIDKYFGSEKKPTLAGLAYALEISRSTFYKYRDENGFSDIIKKSRNRIEALYEKRLIYDKYPTGVIFALKNMGWRDRYDVTTDDEKLPVPIFGVFSSNGTERTTVSTKSS